MWNILLSSWHKDKNTSLFCEWTNKLAVASAFDQWVSSQTNHPADWLRLWSFRVTPSSRDFLGMKPQYLPRTKFTSGSCFWWTKFFKMLLFWKCNLHRYKKAIARSSNVYLKPEMSTLRSLTLLDAWHSSHSHPDSRPCRWSWPTGWWLDDSTTKNFPVGPREQSESTGAFWVSLWYFHMSIHAQWNQSRARCPSGPFCGPFCGPSMLSWNWSGQFRIYRWWYREEREELFQESWTNLH